MFSTKTALFDRLIDKATSKYLLDPDWETTILICDSIRQGDIQPSYAISSIKKKIEDENPHIAKYALLVLESVVKNCGTIVHVEIATRDFMDFLKDHATKGSEPVKSKIVELVQVWSHAFRNDPSYRVVQDTFTQMKTEGFTFPTLKESDAMFVAEKAPEWRDGELCYRCRSSFGPITRKHHCRACGQVFCQKCSSKNSIIPKFGIEKEVRVCDTCFDQINNKSGDKASDEALPAEYLASSLSKQPQVPPTKTEAEIQEEEELQLAIALSQSEQEHKERTKSKNKSNISSLSANDSAAIYSTPNKVASSAILDTSDMDPELARYLNRNYWQQKSQEIASQSTTSAPTTQPSAPVQMYEAKMSNQMQVKEEHLKSEANEERDQFMNALQSSIEIFVNRMKSNHQRGRNIANDSSVQTLFVTLNAMHPTLMKYVQEQEDTRAQYERMQDKLAQLKDARDALDVLRQEHREKRRREQEEMERLRQMQMAKKLEVLRQQKQVYLEYQRQMAQQRMQEQEGEMMRRLEMQKQEQHMRAMQYAAYPNGYPMPMQQVAFSPNGSPHHQPTGGPPPTFVNQAVNAARTQQDMMHMNAAIRQNMQPGQMPGQMQGPQDSQMMRGQMPPHYNQNAGQFQQPLQGYQGQMGPPPPQIYQGQNFQNNQGRALYEHPGQAVTVERYPYNMPNSGPPVQGNPETFNHQMPLYPPNFNGHPNQNMGPGQPKPNENALINFD